jgi:LysR family hydrogen peroxide-inducible transcriptional activator
MSVSSLTLRDLEYVVAVAESKHFGKAAEICRVSQPALSAQIMKVEDQLSVQVFERSRRHVSVTTVGEEIVNQARVVLAEAKKLFEMAATKRSPLSGSFRLGVIATLGPYLMPYFLKNLKQAFPQLQLVLKEGLTDQLLESLKSGALDAVIASPTFDEQGFQLIGLFKEPFFLAAPKGHPLLTKTELKSSDLKASDMILLEDGHCLKDQTLQFCSAQRRGNYRDYHVTSVETLRQMVATGHGYTLLPALAVTDDPRLKNLIGYRAFEGKFVGREIVLVSRKHASNQSEVETLASYLQQSKIPGTI